VLCAPVGTSSAGLDALFAPLPSAAVAAARNRHARATIFFSFCESITMPNIRISPTEVQVDDTIYTFESAGVADDFEACVATVDVSHCVSKYLSIDKRSAHPLAPDDEFPVD
jgi:hypothetical protein